MMSKYTLMSYDSAEAKAWLDALTSYKNDVITHEPIPPCPVSHTGCVSTLVGSSLVYGYVPETDIDYLFYCPSARWQALLQQLGADAWQAEGEYFDTKFKSFRKGKFNLITTDDFEWYERFKTAAELCKQLKVYSKPNRILIHDTILSIGVPKPDPSLDEEVPF